MTRHVTFFLKCLGQREFISWHTPAVPRWHHRVRGLMMRPWRMAANNMRLLRPSWMHTAHNRTSRGGTSRSRRVRLPEHHATTCECVDIRCFHRARLVDVVTFDVLPTKIIRQNKHDVRLHRALVSRKGRNKTKRNYRKTIKQGVSHRFSTLVLSGLRFL